MVFNANVMCGEGVWYLTPMSTIVQVPCISWRSVLLEANFCVSGDNYRPSVCH